MDKVFKQQREIPMSEQNKNGYVLLFSSNEWYKELSLAEIQQVVKQNKAWYDRLAGKARSRAVSICIIRRTRRSRTSGSRF